MKDKLIEKQHLNNCADPADKATIYNTLSTQDKMLEAISSSIEESVNKDSDFIGIILDETTDLTRSSHEVEYLLQDSQIR